MSIVNNVFLIGRLGSDMEVKSIDQGQGKVGNFSLATDCGYRNRETGEWVERADWHRIVTYQTGLIDKLASKLLKGRLVALQGEIKTREYLDDQNVKRWITEILIGSKGSIRLLSKPKDEDHFDQSSLEHDEDGVVQGSDGNFHDETQH